MATSSPLSMVRTDSPHRGEPRLRPIKLLIAELTSPIGIIAVKAFAKKPSASHPAAVEKLLGGVRPLPATGACNHGQSTVYRSLSSVLGFN
jgi:hypothetical protein